jgi:FAD/FMN-containing dehydrogenase
MNRRQFLSCSALTTAGCVSSRGPDGVVLNDVHSALNRTRVSRVSRFHKLNDATWTAGQPCIAMGSRHAMGGQQFLSGGHVIDTRTMRGGFELDSERGLLRARAGAEWPEVITFLSRTRGEDDAPRWSVRQKQTGADALTLGGAISANIHGRGLRLRPFLHDVADFTLRVADGSVLRCSPDENRELFRLAGGGYGLLGVIGEVTLRLEPHRWLRRRVKLQHADGLMAAFEQRMAEGFLYGDWQFAIDPTSDDFLQLGVFSCYEPAPAPSETERKARGPKLRSDDWQRLITLAHTDKKKGFDIYSRYYLGTDGRVYSSATFQMSQYTPGYHEKIGPGSEMITEIYVPRHRLADFLRAAAATLRKSHADVVYSTVRLIEKDDLSVLAWAREPWACTIFNLHVPVDGVGRAAAEDSFRALIDLAIECGGSYYLTYHRWATREQVLACHPRLPEFLRLKEKHDPRGQFQSDWFRHHQRLLG